MRREITDFPDIVIPDDGILREDSILDHFENAHPLEVDVGSGKGRFLLARAAEHPDTNYWGIERQYARVYRTAKKAHRRGLQNVRVARVEAVNGIATLLPDACVTSFYIFFPDPWPKRRHHRRRLICPPFMDLLDQKLMDQGCVHFATDHQDYADVVERVFADDERFVSIEPFQPTHAERTDFEVLFTGLSKPIRRLSIRKQPEPSPKDFPHFLRDNRAGDPSASSG